MENQNQQKSLRPVYSVLAGVVCFAILSATYYFTTTALFGAESRAGSVESYAESVAYGTDVASANNETRPQGGRGYGESSSTGTSSRERKSAYSSVPGMFPMTSERYLTHDDVAGLSKRQLRLMRNEIFARHGYIFKSQDLIDHFNAQSWYTPVSRDVTHELSDIEIKNIDFIKRYE